MKYYTYIYFDPSRDNEPIYVGKGCGARYKSHLKRTDKTLFPNRLNKMKANGIEPIIRKIHFETEQLALDAEAYLIAQLGRKVSGLGPLLNLTDGGEGSSGYKHTESTLKLISDSVKNSMTTEVREQIGQKVSESMTPSHREHLSKKVSELMTPSHREHLSKKVSEWMTPEYLEQRSVKLIAAYTEERREKLKTKLVCPHCGKEGTCTAMYRWHFENCRKKL